MKMLRHFNPIGDLARGERKSFPSTIFYRNRLWFCDGVWKSNNLRLGSIGDYYNNNRSIRSLVNRR